MNPTIPTQETIYSIISIQRKALLQQFAQYNCDPLSFAVWLDLYIRTIPGASVASIAKQLQADRSTIARWRTGDRIPNKLTVRYVVSILT